MRLKELTVQGYKSFATKTRFEFPPGVTAIVGPNGSGKSNIADAVRWALGEQRPTQLRARKTDDLIFSGTERRPRSGLAEVRMVLDNSDRWLDLDYAEVEVTRRAHRDGTNEYAVNGASVRLRDILDLLGGRLGQGGYTVIGQGLVDSSLALRPEERRGMIDEAAGIVPLQRRRDAAVRRLDETDVNLTRVKDVLAELTPRLRRMERLAERAERHDELAGSLVGDLELWYGYHWRRRQAEASAARVEIEAQATRAAGAVEAVALREQAIRVAETELDREGAALGERRRQREESARLASAAREAAAIARTRLEGMAVRLAESAAGSEADSVLAADLRARLATLEAELTAAAVAAEVREHEASDARLRYAEAEAGRRSLAEVWEMARRAAIDAASRQDDTRRRLEELHSAVAASATAVETATADLTGRKVALAETRRLAAVAAESADASARALAEAEEALGAAAAARAAAESVLRAARDAHADAGARRNALAARMRALDALVATAGDGGAQARIEAHAEGMLGRLAQALDVEPGWEDAAAVALGSLLTGILVRDASALRSALASLPEDVDGQVTLIPASFAVGRGGAAGGAWSPVDGELRAVEAIHSQAAPDVVARLLADVAFVEDLVAANESVERSGGPSLAATRTGRLVFRSGVVVAGAPAREVLVQERERRLLPDLLEAATAQESASGAAVDRANEQLAQAGAALAAAAAFRADAEAVSRQASSTAHDTHGRVERLTAEISWEEDAAALRAGEHDSRAARIAALEADLVQLERSGSDAVRGERDALAALDTYETGPTRAEAESAAETARETATRAAAIRGEEDAVRRQLATIVAANEARRLRDDALAQDRTLLSAEAERLAAEEDRLSLELAALEHGLTPEEEAAAAATLALRREAAEIGGLRREAHDAEQRLADDRLAAAKAESRLERVYEQLVADADLLPNARDLPSFVEASTTTVFPFAAVDELPDGLEGRISRVRGQLRDLGAIDPEALAAYREGADHHRLLTEQRTDLLAAEGDIREGLASLEAEMETRFDRTFAVVAAEFERSFPVLFGGGEARLALDDESGGVDILARPPGKRTQPLALLSGGERALTGVALIFALLKASQTPFVVLDEVDAALDEANVDRFRAALEDLAGRMQVVIITHNRGTVQTANTVYGVSMGEDGASQTLSLRVEEVVRT